MEIHRSVSRSVLRYFGGKWALAPWILEHMPPHRIYVEPFGGAASVLLRKPKSKIEVYNDLDEEIVGIFRVIQDPILCRELIRRLKRTPYARREFELAFKLSVNPVIRAQRAIIRAYMAFHHEALFNARKTTFANARHKSRDRAHCKAFEWRNYPRVLIQACRRFGGVIIENQDALRVIQVQDTPETLFFVDPPYVHSTRSSAGYRHEMSDEQHQALLNLLLSVKGRVMISGYPSDLYDRALKGWTRLTRAHYAAASGMRATRTEVLWISPEKSG